MKEMDKEDEHLGNRNYKEFEVGADDIPWDSTPMKRTPS
jgi:hypothetical protein